MEIFLRELVLPITPESLQIAIQKIFDLSNINLNMNDTKLYNILNDDFIQTTNLRNRYNYSYKYPKKIANTNKLSHHFQLSLGIFQYELEICDKIAANSSIEYRYPFLDRKLIEFCLSLPKEQKYSQMWDRIVMRNAMENILPHKIQWRTSKTYLSENFRKNMMLYNKNILENSIIKNSEIISNYVNLEYLKDLYNKYMNSYNVEEHDLWLATVLITWLKNKSYS